MLTSHSGSKSPTRVSHRNSSLLPLRSAIQTSGDDHRGKDGGGSDIFSFECVLAA